MQGWRGRRAFGVPGVDFAERRNDNVAGFAVLYRGRFIPSLSFFLLGHGTGGRGLGVIGRGGIGCVCAAEPMIG